jgi:hypothetical protein
MKAEPRRTPPIAKQLAAAKRQIVELMKRLGMIPVEVPIESVQLDCDHDPALGLRDVDPETRQHVPHQHDDRYLVFRPKFAHDVKTRGTGATTAGSDVGEMRKTRQLVEKRIDRGEVAPDDPSIARWAPKPDRYQPPQKAIQGRGLPGRAADKPSPCRVPDKLAGLPRNTFTERSR